ncbi:unnamed protein product [Vitrella brassicaformis CCMP3155]|uniref:Uncharacterized protein n=4 Tax=Vitrella brassicaformis TaxID=1169539 RepID=A0A0G4G921_VITBC|nr:unnamed protein product [Vitrella brassicaformis CCMP3155]|eukprot:CEM25269.1 unnamed protein product [Vitrella brassicaformis CCMP3155]
MRQEATIGSDDRVEDVEDQLSDSSDASNASVESYYSNPEAYATDEVFHDEPMASVGFGHSSSFVNVPSLPILPQMVAASASDESRAGSIESVAAVAAAAVGGRRDGSKSEERGKGGGVAGQRRRDKAQRRRPPLPPRAEQADRSSLAARSEAQDATAKEVVPVAPRPRSAYTPSVSSSSAPAPAPVFQFTAAGSKATAESDAAGDEGPALVVTPSPSLLSASPLHVSDGGLPSPLAASSNHSDTTELHHSQEGTPVTAQRDPSSAPPSPPPVVVRGPPMEVKAVYSTDSVATEVHVATVQQPPDAQPLDHLQQQTQAGGREELGREDDAAVVDHVHPPPPVLFPSNGSTSVSDTSGTASGRSPTSVTPPVFTLPADKSGSKRKRPPPIMKGPKTADDSVHPMLPPLSSSSLEVRSAASSPTPQRLGPSSAWDPHPPDAPPHSTPSAAIHPDLGSARDRSVDVYVRHDAPQPPWMAIRESSPCSPNRSGPSPSSDLGRRLQRPVVEHVDGGGLTAATRTAPDDRPPFTPSNASSRTPRRADDGYGHTAPLTPPSQAAGAAAHTTPSTPWRTAVLPVATTSDVSPCRSLKRPREEISRAREARPSTDARPQGEMKPDAMHVRRHVGVTAAVAAWRLRTVWEWWLLLKSLAVFLVDEICSGQGPPWSPGRVFPQWLTIHVRSATDGAGDGGEGGHVGAAAAKGEGSARLTRPSLSERVPQNNLHHLQAFALKLEKLMGVGFLVCLDTLVYELTFMPIQACRAFVKILTACWSHALSSVERLLDSDLAFHGRRHSHAHPTTSGGGGGGGVGVSVVVTAPEACDLTRFIALVLSVFIFSYVDISRIYHYIRGQSLVKLYVLFNMLEIFERLIRSLGRDLIDSLMKQITHLTECIQQQHQHTETAAVPPTPAMNGLNKPPPAPPDEQRAEPAVVNQLPLAGGARRLSLSTTLGVWLAAVCERREVQWARRGLRAAGQLPLMQFTLVLLYVVLHSLMHLIRVLSLNVAINSSESAMFLIVVTNNFAEVKSTVFKKQTALSLFVIAASDVVERFQLCCDAFLVFLRMSTSTRRPEASYGDALKWLVIVFVLEVMVDWVKHAFLLKFNHIPAEAFDQYREAVLADLVLSRQRPPDTGGTTTTTTTDPPQRHQYHYQQQHHHQQQQASHQLAHRGASMADKDGKGGGGGGGFCVPCQSVYSYSHIPSRRLGFMALPVSTLMIWCVPRVRWSIPLVCLGATLLFVCLFLVKVLLSIGLVAFAARRRQWCHPEGLANYSAL